MVLRQVATGTGRVPAYGRGVLLVVEHFWLWYRRNWRATVVSSVLQPLLFLLAFGCLLYTSPSPRDKRQSRMPSSA